MKLKYILLILLSCILVFFTSCTDERIDIEQFTISFETNSESIIDNIIVEKGNTIDSIISPTKDGYNFVGWYIDKELMVPFSYSSVINRDLILYAKYEINKYNVDIIVFNKIYKTYSFEYGSTLKGIDTPIVSGYTFLGFYQDEALTTPLVLDETIVTSDTSVYTKWEINTYLVKTVVDDELNNSYNLTYGTKLSSIDKPKKDHYTFDGWYFDKAFKNKCTINTIISSNTTYYGRFIPDIHKVTLMDGSTIYQEENLSYNSTLQDIKVDEKTGYTFDGFYFDEDLTNKVSDDFIITNDVTLYIKWQINKFKVDFYIDLIYLNSIYVDYNTKIIDIITPSKAHYTFDGWYDETIIQKYDDDYKITKDIKLYGSFYINKYNVKFYQFDNLILDEMFEYGTILNSIKLDALEGMRFTHYSDKATNEIIDGEYLIGKDIEIVLNYEISKYIITTYIDSEFYQSFTLNHNSQISDILTPSKEYFKFDGWYKDENFKIKIDNLEKIKSDMTIYARFIQIYVNVTIYSDNTIILNKSYPAGTKALDIALPSKFGHTLSGLYKDSSYLDKLNDDEIIKTDLTLYALFEINKYNVSIYINNQFYETKKIAYNTVINQIEKPTKENHNFFGWYKEDSSSFKDTELVTSDIAIYGYFELIDLTITLYDNDTIYNKETVKYGDSASFISIPKKDGYTFISFYLDKELTKKLNDDFVFTKDISIYIKWQINSYNVKLYVDGVLYDTLLLTYDALISDITKPTKDHFDFYGWYKDANYKTLLNKNATVKGDLSLYGKFELVKLKVTLMDGSSILNTITLFYGDTLNNVSYITKQGYSLEGIFNDVACLDKTNLDTQIFSDITLYTKWNILSYIVKIYHENELTETKQLEYGTKLSSIPKLTKENYEFHWYSDSSFKTKLNDDFVITGDISIYGHFTKQTFKIYYYDNNKLIKTVSLEAGLKIKDAIKPTKTGYTLVGLYLDSAFSTILTDETIEKDIKIYTLWDILSYNVTINIDGVTLEVLSINYNTLVSKIKAYSKEHYIFDGWYSDESFKNKLSTTSKITKDTTLYGRFNKCKYSIKIMVDDILYDEVSLYYLDNINTISTPIKTGYTFDWFYFDKDFLNIVDSNYSVSSNITLYAKFNINKYTLKVIAGGGILDEITVDYNTLLKDIADPVRENYIFIGWYTDVSLKMEAPSDTKITTDLTLYTKWQSKLNIPYKVNHYLENLKGDGYTLDLCESFSGNFDDLIKINSHNYVGFTPSDFNDFVRIELDGSSVFSIYYKRNIHTVTYIYDDFKIYKEETFKYGSPYEVISDNLIDGYIFYGWYNDASFTLRANLDLIKDQDEVIYGYVEKIIEGSAGLIYSLNDDKVSYSVIGYTGTSKTLIIPNGYKNYPVTKIINATSSIIQDVKISENVLSIEENAFKDSVNLRSIILPHSLKAIHDSAFTGSLSLSSINIPESVETIGLGAFYGCLALREITIDDANPFFSTTDGVLYNKEETILLLYPSNKDATSFLIKDSVIKIERLAIAYALSLEVIDLNNVTIIDPENLNNCPCLKKVILGKNISSLSDSILTNCPLLEKLEVSDENLYYSSTNGVLYNKEQTILIKYPANLAGDTFIIPDSVLVINYHAFYNLANLLYLVIPNTVLYIEASSIIDSDLTVLICDVALSDAYSKYGIIVKSIIYLPNFEIVGGTVIIKEDNNHEKNN